MKTYRIPHSDRDVSRIAYGCMNLGGRWDHSPVTEDERRVAREAIRTALETGINLFDHADIYTHGKSETLFGEVLKATPGLRDSIVLQSKCGIRFPGEPHPGNPQRYDFSYEHILRSVEGSLRRLQTDYLDILLLHRPDPLVEPEEVARAFDELQVSGKVRYFGVSNHTAGQIELLHRFVRQPLVINQVELSLTHAYLIGEGILANQTGATTALASGTLDYCRAAGILVQAWAPLAGGRLFNQDESRDVALTRTSELISKLAAEKQTSPEGIMLAWLLRHPAGFQPIIGTTRPDRIKASCLADEVSLSREEWYALFISARGEALP